MGQLIWDWMPKNLENSNFPIHKICAKKISLPPKKQSQRGLMLKKSYNLYICFSEEFLANYFNTNRNLNFPNFWGIQSQISCMLKRSTYLRTNSDKKIYWLGRYAFFLGFVMSKKPKSFAISYSNRKFITQPLRFFWHNKTQKERVSTKTINFFSEHFFSSNHFKDLNLN